MRELSYLTMVLLKGELKMSDITKINLAKDVLKSVDEAQEEYHRVIHQYTVTRSALNKAEEIENPSKHVLEYIESAKAMVEALKNEKEHMKNRYIERLDGSNEILSRMVGWYEDLLVAIDLQEAEIQRLRKKEKETSKAFDDLYNKMKGGN